MDGSTRHAITAPEDGSVNCDLSQPGLSISSVMREGYCILRRIDPADRRLDTGAMGVRTRRLDIKAGAAKLRADRAARLEAESALSH
jgi:hypothetical protein